MKLEQIRPLKEAQLGDPSDEPQFNYDGEIDPQVSNIPGQPYSLYVNEADSTLPHSITFMIASDDDDGVVWEVDLGKPSGQSTDYEAPSDQGPGGHDVQWSRNTPERDVIVQDDTQNQMLSQLTPHITDQLKQMRDSSNFEGAQQLFTQVLQRLNQ